MLYTPRGLGETYGQALYRLDCSQAVPLVLRTEKCSLSGLVNSTDIALWSQTSTPSARG